MLVRTAEHRGKGWFAGPWDSSLTVAVGFADLAVDEPHVHHEMHEIYLIARGSSTAVVDGVEVQLHAGDVLVVEPGERHTMRASTPDYLHFGRASAVRPRRQGGRRLNDATRTRPRAERALGGRLGWR